MMSRPSLWCCSCDAVRVAALRHHIIYYVCRSASRCHHLPFGQMAFDLPLGLEDGPGRADDPLGRPPADAPLRGEVRRGRAGAGAQIGQDAGEPLVARVRVRLGGGAGGAGPVAAAHARAAVGRGPHRGPLPQRRAAAPAGRCRSRRARGSSPGGGWRGSRPGWSSAACGRLRRRRPGRPGRRPGRPGSATRSCPAR